MARPCRPAPASARRALSAAVAGDGLDTGEEARIRDGARERRCRRRERRGQERPATLALAALEVAVRRADGHLAGRELIAVHRDAHRAARLAPVRAGGAEDLVEPLRLGLAL